MRCLGSCLCVCAGGEDNHKVMPRIKYQVVSISFEWSSQAVYPLTTSQANPTTGTNRIHMFGWSDVRAAFGNRPGEVSCKLGLACY